MNTLYWFTDDLRIADNPALIAAASDTNLTCVYCMDDAYFRTDRFGNQPIGKHRWRFLCESLRHLNDELLALGQTVNILRGDPNAAVATLLKAGRFDRVIRANSIPTEALILGTGCRQTSQISVLTNSMSRHFSAAKISISSMHFQTRSRNSKRQLAP